jgi:DHA1 family multidrug resistance protein-like MFS transporter
MYLGNVIGPLIGAGVSAMAGYRWVFIATALVVLLNVWQLAVMLRRKRQQDAMRNQMLP